MSEGMTREGFALFYGSYVRSSAEGAARGSSIVDPDDVEMAIWEFLYSRWDYNSQLEPHNVKWLISHKANEFAGKERHDYEHFRGNFIYTTTFVRAVLEEAVWVDLDGVPDIDARVDVMEAYKKLTHGQQVALFKRYGLGEELTVAEKKAASRASQRIADILNDSVALDEVDLSTL